MTPHLETARLLLRPLELADAEQTQLLFPQWEVVKYLNPRVPWPFPADGAYTYYRDVALPAMARGEGWYWTLRLRTAPERIIGAITLEKKENENRGFWLVPEWWGQGLASEACEAVTEFWFNVLRMPVLRAPKAVPNEASRRISLRQGMSVVATEERDYVSGRYLTEIWEITAEEWRARRRPPGSNQYEA